MAGKRSTIEPVMVLGASFYKFPTSLLLFTAHWQNQDHDQTCCHWEWNNPHIGKAIWFLIENFWVEYIIILGYFFSESIAVLFISFHQAWWLMPVITMLERPRHEDYREFEAILLNREFQLQPHSDTLSNSPKQVWCQADFLSSMESFFTLKHFGESCRPC